MGLVMPQPNQPKFTHFVADDGNHYSNFVPDKSQTATAPSMTSPTTDTRNGFQQAVDLAASQDKNNPIAAYSPGLARFSGGIIKGSGLPLLAHPMQAAKSIWDTVTDAEHPNESVAQQMGRGIQGAWQSAKDKMADIRQNGITPTLEGGLGQIAGNLAGGALLGEGVGAGLKMAGPVIERTGLSLGNRSLGAVGPKPFKYGANPARGAFDTGVLPAMSKSSAAIKAENALEPIGQQISGMVSGGNSVPLNSIASSIENPLNEARGIVQGPGGGNRSVEPINALQVSMSKRAPGASSPVYGHGAGTPFTPSETVAAMSKPMRGLPAPMKDIPLSSESTVSGTPSKPIILSSSRSLPRDSPFYGNDTSTRLEPGMSFVPPESEFPEVQSYGNLGPNEYMGEEAGQRGGIAPSQGVLRRPSGIVEGGQSQASPFADMRHPTATALDLWRTIQNIDKNTRFNPDPEVEGVNELRRDMRGGLRGNLEEAVSGLKPISQRYADVKGAQDVLDKTLHSGSRGIGGMLKVPMMPIESSVGKGLYTAGKGMSAIKTSPFSAANWVNPLLYYSQNKDTQRSK